MANGQLNERRVAEAYEKAGYRTYRPETTMYGENDVFGEFDILALDPGEGLRMVQVKSNGAPGIEAFCEDTEPFRKTPGLHCEFACVYDGEPGPYTRSWAVRVIVPDGSDSRHDSVDERDADVPEEGEGLIEWLEAWEWE